MVGGPVGGGWQGGWELVGRVAGAWLRGWNLRTGVCNYFPFKYEARVTYPRFGVKESGAPNLGYVTLASYLKGK